MRVTEPDLALSTSTQGPSGQGRSQHLASPPPTKERLSDISHYFLLSLPIYWMAQNKHKDSQTALSLSHKPLAMGTPILLEHPRNSSFITLYLSHCAFSKHKVNCSISELLYEICAHKNTP